MITEKEYLTALKTVTDYEKQLNLQIVRRCGGNLNHNIADSSDFELQRLFDWLQDAKREPAQTKFTAGMTRNVAREFEYLLKHSR